MFTAGDIRIPGHGRFGSTKGDKRDGWGLNTPNGGVDDVAFIQQMYDAFQAAKNSPSGLAYESYFDLDDCTYMITDGCNPNAGARYRQLF